MIWKHSQEYKYLSLSHHSRIYKGSYLTQNKRSRKSGFKYPIRRLKPSQQSELNQKQAQNAEANATFAKQHNFKTLAIQTGFRLNHLKKYYESTVFHLKGYSIKYESIRRTKLYQKLKA